MARGLSGVWSCVAYLIVDFGRPMGWLPALGHIQPGVIAGVWGIFAVLSKRDKIIPRPIWYILAFCALMVWQVPWATNNRWALWGLQDFAIIVFGGVLPIALLPATIDQVRRLLVAYVLIHVSLAIYGLTHAGFGPGGWIGDENDLALALNAAIGVGVYVLTATKGWGTRLLLTASIGTLVAGVVATKSRGGFVGLATLGAYLLLAGPHRRAVALTLVLGLIVMVNVAPDDYWSEIKTISHAAEKGDTGEERLYFWGLGWKMFLDHPITGVGTANYGILAPEYQDPNRTGWRSHTWGRVAHSLYFTLIPEQGLVGVAIFVGLLASLARLHWRFRREARDGEPETRTRMLLASGAMTGVVAVLVTGAFLSVLYYPVLWVLAGFLSAIDRIGSTSEKPAAPVRERKLERAPSRPPQPVRL